MVNIVLIGVGLLVVMVFSGFKIVPEAHAFIIERFGKYCATWRKGVHYEFPFIDKISKKVSLKEQFITLSSQNMSTRDKINIRLDIIVGFQVVYPKLYTYGVNEPIASLENLILTTLRDVIGDTMHDSVVALRDDIVKNVQALLNEMTHEWGLTTRSVSLKNILLPGERVGLATAARSRKEAVQNRDAVLDRFWEAPQDLSFAASKKEAVQDIDQEYITVVPINVSDIEFEEAVISRNINISQDMKNDFDENSRTEIERRQRKEAILTLSVQKDFIGSIAALNRASLKDKEIINKMVNLFKAAVNDKLIKDPETGEVPESLAAIKKDFINSLTSFIEASSIDKKIMDKMLNLFKIALDNKLRTTTDRREIIAMLKDFVHSLSFLKKTSEDDKEIVENIVNFFQKTIDDGSVQENALLLPSGGVDVQVNDFMSVFSSLLSSSDEEKSIINGMVDILAVGV
jgi:hypothetical protein